MAPSKTSSSRATAGPGPLTARLRYPRAFARRASWREFLNMRPSTGAGDFLERSSRAVFVGTLPTASATAISSP